ncbi:hypothetical protein GCM10017688_65050 [Streptomyces ramulosus]
MPAFDFEADTVRLVVAEGTEGGRAETLAQWQRRALPHEVEHGGGCPRRPGYVSASLA